MNINAIKDAVKALAQSLQLTTIFPAGLFVLVNAYLVLPLVYPDLDLTTPPVVTILVSLALMLSYTLYAFNFPLIRLLEGYMWRDTDLVQWLERQQQHEFDELYEELRELRAQHEECSDYLDGLGGKAPLDDRLISYTEQWRELQLRLPRLERRFDRDYPPTRDRVLATRLGNTIAAFEDYPRTRYGMDSVALWARLIPVLRDREYLGFVTQEKAVLDFLMNTCIVIAVLASEVVLLTLYLWYPWIALFTIGSAGLVVVLLYNGMIIAARQWGTTVRVAFDLYRHDLHQYLQLRPTGSFGKEREQWQTVSEFFLCRRERMAREFGEFTTQSELAKRKDKRPA